MLKADSVEGTWAAWDVGACGERRRMNLLGRGGTEVGVGVVMGGLLGTE